MHQGGVGNTDFIGNGIRISHVSPPPPPHIARRWWEYVVSIQLGILHERKGRFHLGVVFRKVQCIERVEEHVIVAGDGVPEDYDKQGL